MELKTLERKKGELNLPLAYLGIALLVILSAYILYLLKGFPPVTCVFKGVTGYPCPTCGSTRALFHLSRLEIAAAFRLNPLVFLAGAAFILWVCYGVYMLASGKRFKITLSKRESFFLRWGILVLLVLNWVYLVSAGV
ncbi:MAG: DUF2752 domain-containing protein [bacterium]|nr:DUF2752 domain-containing protein [bacterium]